MEKDWYLYLVRCRDGSLYTGISVDMKRRLRQHNGEIKGGAKYTSKRRPVLLVYVELMGPVGKSLAMKKERRIKKYKKKDKEAMIKQNIERTQELMKALSFSLY